MPLDKDSFANTFLVAGLLCLGCSFLVSAAAVALKPIKNRNIQLDRKNNILQVAGFSVEDIDKAGGIEELFASRFKAKIIDLDTGEPAAEACEAAMKVAGKEFKDVVAEYDQLWASKSKKGLDWAANFKGDEKPQPVCRKIEKKTDVAGVKYREKFSHVFVLEAEDGSVEKYVFPVRGMGLWSLMQGYLAVEPDLKTVAGLTFYDQAETPGLGGEVMNPKWKNYWTENAEPRKTLFGNDGSVSLTVSKGDQTKNPYGVDALSGATITSNGVSNMLEYWMGPNGFGPFIEQQKSGGGNPSAQLDNTSKTGVTNG
jgi:Na+-transporting NADH:ubiquinone oxidoreductase subunit C